MRIRAWLRPGRVTGYTLPAVFDRNCAAAAATDGAMSALPMREVVGAMRGRALWFHYIFDNKR